RQCLIFQPYMLLNDLAFSFEQHIARFILNVSVCISLLLRFLFCLLLIVLQREFEMSTLKQSSRGWKNEQTEFREIGLHPLC
ncbi:hypothetical protein ABTE98_19545, partial [Acinetobacter baumannii]